MNRTVYVNGSYLPEENAVVSIFDRGFLMGDAVYEFTTVIEGKMIDFDAHMQRLERSLSELDMPFAFDRDAMLEIHRELITRNALLHGGVYVQISRGNPGDRDFLHPDKDEVEPTLVMFTQVKSPHDDFREDQGWSVMTIDDLRWHRRDIKSVQLLYTSLVKTMAAKGGYDDAWLVEDGFVTEGTSNNAYIIKDGVIITRQLSHDILHGITRAALLRYASERQIRIEERPFSVKEALEADEAFITSSTTFVMPVIRIDGQDIGDGKPGKHAIALRQIYIEKSRLAAI